jgi:tripartite-type tricarboxylate transporter receptor subunit TctC
VPAAAELVPGYAITIWYAMLGPRATPPEVVRRIAEVIAPLREGSPLAARMEASGMEVMLDGPAPLAERLAREVPQWKQVAAQMGIRLD